jgi:hypothetical protein
MSIKVAGNQQGLLLWWYSVIVWPQPLLCKVVLLMLYSIVRCNSSVELELNSEWGDELIVLQPPSRKTNVTPSCYSFDSSIIFLILL